MAYKQKSNPALNGNFVTIMNLFVKENYRHFGVGTMLINAVESWAKRIFNDCVIELDCDYGDCFDGVWDYEADRIGIVSSSSITLKTNVTLNIVELEAFFNSVVSQAYMADDGILRKRRPVI